MGKADGFMQFNRELPSYRKPDERIRDYNEIYLPFPLEKTQEQSARCMDCGVPFCHNGCPLGNNIPDFNDAVYHEKWEEAFQILSSTNNFPEFTGRICPAPCEASCVLSINNKAVAIEHIEKTIAEVAHDKGYYKPQPPTSRTGKRVAIIGSGPAGLAAAAQLNKAGHWVTVYERSEKPGGLLRYGIPDFKLEKSVLDRRLLIMEQEGVTFKNNAHIGINVDPKQLQDEYDAVVIAGGASAPRDLPIKGRDINGVHFAMDFLTQQNKRIEGRTTPSENILATGKHVIVIGGGDTGSDCVGTSNRQGAASVTQIELLPMPPSQRTDNNPWPLWPMTLVTSSSHEEGVTRQWAILTKEFIHDSNGKLAGLHVIDIEWKVNDDGKLTFEEIANTERTLPCDLVLLAIGFTGAEKSRMLTDWNVALDERTNIITNNYMTTTKGIFSAGDIRRGQSLVVWAISEGREAAHAVDEWLMGSSSLETKDESLVIIREHVS